jgi:hypothetical protein
MARTDGRADGLGQAAVAVRCLRRRHHSAAKARATAIRMRIITSEIDETLTPADRPRVRETLRGSVSRCLRVLRTPLLASARTTGADNPPEDGGPAPVAPVGLPVAEGMFSQYWFAALVGGPVHRPPGCTAYAGAAHTKPMTTADSRIFHTMSMTARR